MGTLLLNVQRPICSWTSNILKKFDECPTEMFLEKKKTFHEMLNIVCLREEHESLNQC